MRRRPVWDETHRRARLTVVVVLAGVAAPHMVRPAGLPTWVSALFLLALAWRVWLEISDGVPPPRWLLWGVAAAAFLPLPLSFGYRPSRDLFLSLYTILVGLKVLEARSLRDWTMTVFLSQFLVLTNFLYSQSVPTALYMVVAVWLGLAALADLGDRVGTVSPLVNARLASRLLLQAVPLAATMFLLFPRIQGQLWSLPGDSGVGFTGLSEQLAPGMVQQVVLSDEVAFRVAFDEDTRPPEQMYWRGLVLEHTDGERWWWEAPRYKSAEVIPQSPGAGAGYAVTLEPHGKRWLFALDLPSAPPANGRMLSGYQLITKTLVRERRRYTAKSVLHYRTGALSGAERQYNLAVPRVSERVRALASSWRAESGDDAELVALGVRHFAVGGYTYTLSPPDTGPDYVEPFLFETRSGFCEHYASSFALLMRLAGVPSRVVVGYLGGERNPVGEFWVVSQAQAHAWTEVWLPEKGWLRVDPTAVVQPERLTGLVDNGSSGRPAVGYVQPAAGWVRRGLRRLATLWGVAENTWDQWVLGYDVQRQMRLLRGLGVDNPTWRRLTAVLAGVAAGILALLGMLVVWRAMPPRDPVLRAYARYCRKVARRGLPRGASEAPLEFSLRVSRRWPEKAEEVSEITALYGRLRYGPTVGRDEVRQLWRSVRRFRPGPGGGSPGTSGVPIMDTHGRG